MPLEKPCYGLMAKIMEMEVIQLGTFAGTPEGCRDRAGLYGHDRTYPAPWTAQTFQHLPRPLRERHDASLSVLGIAQDHRPTLRIDVFPPSGQKFRAAACGFEGERHERQQGRAPARVDGIEQSLFFATLESPIPRFAGRGLSDRAHGILDRKRPFQPCVLEHR